MDLNNLKVNKITKLDSVLKEVFGVNFNFGADGAKLQKVKTFTESKIKSLRDNGVAVNDKQYQKLLLVLEGIKEAMSNKPVVTESELDQAEVLLAAKQMADDLQKMAENLASMQVEELMSITNAMKEEVGVAEAETFSQSAEMAIGQALEAVKKANDDVSNAVLVAQGQAPESDMSMEPAPEAPMDMDAPAEEPAGDDFEGADAASAETDADGREMKEESVDPYLKAIKMVKEAQSEGKVSKDVLKKAFAELKR
tara:strand:+ start:1041 stop:1802 length:762 start_codon:yes stop_codon:yes gene_type:complete